MFAAFLAGVVIAAVCIAWVVLVAFTVNNLMDMGAAIVRRLCRKAR